MTNGNNLGRLEPVELREIWESESGAFTPWLAQENNLALLGDTIGIELELEAQEKDVGPFRADLLCKDTATNNWVIIENQLERTDHCHLGQLLTYAAGLKAVTIIWIAERFTEEHRAALDWLNEITEDNFTFFGLEIELWRIGNSQIAPKFNIVCQPNDWSKTISEAAQGEITEIKLLQQEYWTKLRDILIDKKSVVKPTKPLPQSYYGFAVGKAHFWMNSTVNTQKHWIQVSLSCGGNNALDHFLLLKKEQDAIEKEIGCPLNWEELPGKKEKRISLRYNTDPTNRDDWPAQHAWLVKYLEAFFNAFAPRIKSLDLDEQPEPDDE
jgi:hypothetical protein